MIVVGVDPGSTTGLAVVTWDSGRNEFLDLVHLQIQGDLAVGIITGLIDKWWISPVMGGRVALSVESFVVRGRSARSRTPGGGQTARDVIGGLRAYAERQGVRFDTRTAALAKGWATDSRLDAAGLLQGTRGEPHARDAMRHALFTGRQHGGWPDPMGHEYRVLKHLA